MATTVQVYGEYPKYVAPDNEMITRMLYLRPDKNKLHKTSDISHFCELEWFEWIMFWGETALFLEDVLKLGHYLEPSIDIGPAMTTKIYTENGQVLHRSTYRSLTPDELLDQDGPDAWEQYMATVYERLRSQVLPRELEDIGLESTP